MDGEGIFEGYVEIVGSSIGIWSMQPIADIEAYHHHTEVISKAGTSAKSNILEESFSFQFASRTQRVVFQEPNVACIEKSSSVQIANDRETIFRIDLKLESTSLVEISIHKISWSAVATRAY